ncbi:hypothetical protein [Aureimonas pseudogalii]|uniref:Uncharacterized protein n=1 Tax=Aureimonas pseudogalii TaxID=1744844 RepID=A0A7W6H7L7_9HYPH|nr:hypothetical protein [Aureimonas pseudogalii]MBB3999992.1 hypothetical protein [Aureimonas pseudogalii]
MSATVPAAKAFDGAALSGAASPLLPHFCVADPLPGDASVLRCSGLVGTDVFLAGSEDDRRVALGAPAGFPSPLPKAARLSRTLDWRLLGERPVAALLRYGFAAEGADPAMQWIVVLKPGTPERPGCVVALVDGEAGAAARTTATRVADEEAAGFRCGVDRPGLVGRAGDATRRLGTLWLARQP